jgi:hypothetical protein
MRAFNAAIFALVAYRRRPPGLGADSDEVLAWLDHGEELT